MSARRLSLTSNLFINGVGSEGISDLTWILPKLDLLKSIRAILLERHLAHLCLTSKAAESILDDCPATSLCFTANDERCDFVDLEDKALFEEPGQALGVDKARFSGDD
ncbi:hypothetical protein HG530_001098 [Fusarium avenaceum]|nr:hypothetical protein HG530_001098 [Fusarium avenaceum]